MRSILDNFNSGFYSNKSFYALMVKFTIFSYRLAFYFYYIVFHCCCNPFNCEFIIYLLYICRE